MNIDMGWIATVGALFLGFILKVLFDELRIPKLVILDTIGEPFKIARPGAFNRGDNSYIAYRIRVLNKQKRFLNGAAENCMVWIKLTSTHEDYQLAWVGSWRQAITVNVGDVREIDLCARGHETGNIYAPTEKGYFEPSPRQIGNGEIDLEGKIRITSKNGKKAERKITIRPASGNRLDIIVSN